MTTYIDVVITAPISEDDAKRVAKEVKQAAIAAGIDPDAVVVDVSQITTATSVRVGPPVLP